MKKDISNLQDIQLLVDTFYGKVRENKLIGPIFEAKIQERWPEHLSKMYSFWQTVLLEEHTYSGRPFPPHSQLPIGQEHFDAWLMIFKETVDFLFEGPLAEEAKWRGAQMGKMFLSKIEYFRDYTGKTML